MNDNYILIETRLFEKGRMRKKCKLNALGGWDEQVFQIKAVEEQEKFDKPFIFKNKTIIGLQGDGFYFKDKYDAYGRVIKMSYFDDNLLTHYSEMKYYSPYTKTLCSQIIFYKTPRKIDCISKFEYNSEGEKIQEKCCYPNGDLAWYADYMYNNDGRISEVLTYNNENILIYKIITFYTSDGEKIKKEKHIHKDCFHKWQPENGGILDFWLWTS